MSVTTPLGADALLLQGLTIYEATSEPFEITLDMLSENFSISPTTMVWQPITVSVKLPDDSERYYHGLVRRFSQGARVGRFASYRAEVVPALWFLTLSSDCRIFQNVSVVDIIHKVLSDAAITDVKTSLVTTYPPREYCVQYRESHFAFISRLMEEEGIFYFFEHEEGKHTLVLADAKTAVKAGPVSTLRVAASEAGRLEYDDVIDSFEVDTTVRSGKVVLGDYDPLQPKTLLQNSSSSVLPITSSEYSLYDYPGKFATTGDGATLARVRMEAEEASSKIITCTTNSRGLVSGHKVDIKEHYNSALDGSYHILSLSTSARIEGYGATTGDETEGFSFDARFTAMPATMPFRPQRRTPKSIVYGTQTALVVGREGEEIYVDNHGRVKVQFFWDRQGAKNENSSCWVRVATTWAGKNWGAVHVPRIGQEVVVDFLEGDPDRPIITGAVYNADQTVPYTLPDNMTQSGVKSRSTKGGSTDTFNEFRFEDKNGSEQIWLHAQKDLSTKVVNDSLHEVGHDRTTTITNDETKTVKEGNELTTIEKGSRTVKVSEGAQQIEVTKGDDTYTVGTGKQTIVVNGNRSLTVKTGNYALEVQQGNVSHKVAMGNVTTNIDLGKQSIEAMQGIELKVGQNSIKIDPSGITIQGLQVKVEGQVQTEIKGLMTQINGDAMVKVKGAVTMIN